MNFCNCPTCNTNDCPAASELDSLRTQNQELMAALTECTNAAQEFIEYESYRNITGRGNNEKIDEWREKASDAVKKSKQALALKP